MGLKIRTDAEGTPADPVKWVKSLSSASIVPDLGWAHVNAAIGECSAYQVDLI